MKHLSAPMVRLNRMPEEGSAEILVKVEALNVGGSIKTRTAYNMIRAAEEEGIIDKDSIIVVFKDNDDVISLDGSCKKRR